MSIILLRKSATPLSTQVYEQIKASILSGALKVGECLPSIRSLARELEISVITVKLAYERLESEGLIKTVQGKGCFVSDREEDKLRARQDALTEAYEAVKFCRECGVSESEVESMIKKVFNKI